MCVTIKTPPQNRGTGQIYFYFFINKKAKLPQKKGGKKSRLNFSTIVKFYSSHDGLSFSHSIDDL